MNGRFELTDPDNIKCDTCRHATAMDDAEGLVCTRYPPAYCHATRPYGWTGFPRINPAWVCGEHTPIEGKSDD